MSAGIKTHPVVTIVALLSLALVFAGILKHVVAMIFGKNDRDLQVGESGKVTIIPIIILVAILSTLSVFIPDSLQTLLFTATMNR